MRRGTRPTPRPRGLVTAAVVQGLAAAALALLRPGEPTVVAVLLAAAGATLVLVLTAGVRGHRIAARVTASSSPASTHERPARHVPGVRTRADATPAETVYGRVGGR